MQKVKAFKDRLKRIIHNNPTAGPNTLIERIEELYTKMLEEELASKRKEKDNGQ